MMDAAGTKTKVKAREEAECGRGPERSTFFVWPSAGRTGQCRAW
jgi:hypothetical protein